MLTSTARNLEILIPRLLLLSLIGYLAARSLGSCPIQWRRNRYWLLIIIVAGAYWAEYLLQFIPALQHRFTYVNVAADLAGAFTGIVIRLKTGYQHCRCRFMVQERRLSETSLTEPDVGTFTHLGHNPALPAIIAKTFGWKEVEINRAGFRVGFICTGKGLVSYPHISYGNVQFHHASDPANQQSLLKQHLPLLPFSSVEVRLVQTGAESANGKVVSLLDLSTDPWQRFTPNLRRKIRKSKKNGYEFVQGGKELLDDFYRTYASHIRSIGSAPLTRKWFRNLLQHYTNGFCGIFLLKRDGTVAGTAFNLEYQGFYENNYFAVPKQYQRDYGSYALTYAMIEHARTIGATTYSFGRSTPNSGVHRFKQQWNTTDHHLNWLKYPKETINLRHHTTLNNIWKTLPIPLRKPLDSYISKWIY